MLLLAGLVLAALLVALLVLRTQTPPPRGVSLAVETSGSGPAVVDAVQLGQAVENLVRNAIEATPAGGSVMPTRPSRRLSERVVRNARWAKP